MPNEDELDELAYLLSLRPDLIPEVLRLLTSGEAREDCPAEKHRKEVNADAGNPIHG